MACRYCQRRKLSPISCPGRICLALPSTQYCVVRLPSDAAAEEPTATAPRADGKTGRNGHHGSGACHRAGCEPRPVLSAGERWRNDHTSRQVREPFRRGSLFFPVKRRARRRSQHSAIFSNQPPLGTSLTFRSVVLPRTHAEVLVDVPIKL